MEQEICPISSSCHHLPPHHDSTPPLQFYAPHRKVPTRKRRRSSLWHLSAPGLLMLYCLDAVLAFTFLLPSRKIYRLQSSPLIDELASVRQPRPVILDDTIQHDAKVTAMDSEDDILVSSSRKFEIETNETRTSASAPQPSKHPQQIQQEQSIHQKKLETVKPKTRPLKGLSRTHQSLLSKTTHMRRQRFVTGKYPLYVEVKQNPTKKWLGLAESRIYLNG